MQFIHAVLTASSTTTTTFNVHRGAVLPVARVVVIAIPSTALLLFWFLIVRPRRK